jgi:hypothetical protein
MIRINEARTASTKVALVVPDDEHAFLLTPERLMQITLVSYFFKNDNLNGMSVEDMCEKASSLERRAVGEYM